MGREDETSDFNAGEERVFEWEEGLPNSEDLTPLSQMLIPTDLASAFSITPEPCRNMGDVDRASWDTVSKLQSRAGIGLATNRSKTLPPLSNGCFLHENGANANDDLPSSPTGDDDDDDDGKRDQDSESAGLLMENSMDDLSARALERPRLVWTPQLHKRFVDVVGHLGIKNAVPKTIMQLMNVEGLTRENVASHLQKYRLYLKRMQGFPDQGPSSSLDQLFASTPIPNGGRAGPSVLPVHREEPSSHMPIPLPYVAGRFVPMPVVGVAHGRGPLPIHGPATYNMFETQSANGCGRNLIPQRMSAGDQPRDW